MAKHTEGPWEIEPRCGKGVWLHAQGGPSDYVALACWRDDADHGETDANARLISTAPELIEPWLSADNRDWDYLINLIPDSGHGQFWKDILRQHRAAITKAIGDHP